MEFFGGTSGRGKAIHFTHDEQASAYRPGTSFCGLPVHHVHTDRNAEYGRRNVSCSKCINAAAKPVEREPEVDESIQITDRSLNLFLVLANDAGNWSGTPPTDSNVDMTKAEQGNLTQLKRAGLVKTINDDGSAWVIFTERGIALAESHGIPREVFA